MLQDKEEGMGVTLQPIRNLNDLVRKIIPFVLNVRGDVHIEIQRGAKEEEGASGRKTQSPLWDFTGER